MLALEPRKRSAPTPTGSIAKRPQVWTGHHDCQDSVGVGAGGASGPTSTPKPIVGKDKMFKTPKSALHEFFQVRGGIPSFDVTSGPPPPAPPNFTCHLTIPSLPPGSDHQPTQTVFIADGRTKKAAEHAAADKALEYIVGIMPVPGAAAPQPPQQSHSQPASAAPSAAGASGSGVPGASPGLAAAQQPANASGEPFIAADDNLSKFIDGLGDEDKKRLLVEAQQRITALETQVATLQGSLAKYTDWHRRVRELALENVV